MVAQLDLPFIPSLKANLFVSYCLACFWALLFPFCFVYSAVQTCLTKLWALAEMPSLMVQSLS